MKLVQKSSLIISYWVPFNLAQLWGLPTAMSNYPHSILSTFHISHSHSHSHKFTHFHHQQNINSHPRLLIIHIHNLMKSYHMAAYRTRIPRQADRKRKRKKKQTKKKGPPAKLFFPAPNPKPGRKKI